MFSESSLWGDRYPRLDREPPAAVGTHPTLMHSCFFIILIVVLYSGFGSGSGLTTIYHTLSASTTILNRGRVFCFCVVHRRVSGTQRILWEIAPMARLQRCILKIRARLWASSLVAHFTLPKTDLSTDSDSKLDGYIVLCRTFHIAQTWTQTFTPCFCVGQASESISGNVNEPLQEALHTGTDLGFSVGTGGGGEDLDADPLVHGGRRAGHSDGYENSFIMDVYE